MAIPIHPDQFLRAHPLGSPFILNHSIRLICLQDPDLKSQARKTKTLYLTIPDGYDEISHAQALCAVSKGSRSREGKFLSEALTQASCPSGGIVPYKRRNTKPFAPSLAYDPERGQEFKKYDRLSHSIREDSFWLMKIRSCETIGFFRMDPTVIRNNASIKTFGDPLPVSALRHEGCVLPV